MKKKITLISLTLLALSITLSACGIRVLPSSWPGILVDGDVVYVAYKSSVYALDLEDGDEIWKFPGKADNGLSFYSAPALTEEGQLLAGSYSNVFYSLDPETGEENWRNEDVKNYWIGSSLAFEGKIFAPSADHNLYSLDPEDGDQEEFFTTEKALWATPITDGEKIYLAGMDHNLYALPVGGGEPVWTYPLNGAMVNPPALSPDGILFVGTFANEVVAIDSQNGNIVWETETDDWVWASPSYGDGMVFAADMSGMIYALDAETGELIWDKNTESVITGTPLYYEGMLFVSNDGGEVWALDPSNDGKRMWTEDLNGKGLGSPVAAGDLVLFNVVNDKTDEFVAAFTLDGDLEWVFPDN